jgi:hypothetical protein
MGARRCGRCLARSRAAGDGPVEERWVVLVEAVREPGGPVTPMDEDSARTMLHALGDDHGVMIQCQERVGLQVWVTAGGPAMALSAALTRWRLATAAVAPARWRVVRAEILTDAEFEKDFYDPFTAG